MNRAKDQLSARKNLRYFSVSADFVDAMSGNVASGASATTVNGEGGAGGHHAPPKQPSAVTPEMMFKISKKIAQLTKVIYSLNTRNDDLELELEGMRANYEQRLAEAVAGLQAADGRGEADGAETVGATGVALNGEAGTVYITNNLIHKSFCLSAFA